MIRTAKPRNALLVLQFVMLVSLETLHHCVRATVQGEPTVNKEDILSRLTVDVIDTNITFGGVTIENLEYQDILPQNDPFVYSEPDILSDGEDRQIALKNTSMWDNRVNDVVQIPYVLDRSYGEVEEGLIIQAMRKVSELSHVVEFIPRRGQEDYIYIYDGASCSSLIGRIGGMQHLSLNREHCMSGVENMSIIQNELAHVLGIWKYSDDVDHDMYLKQDLDLKQKRGLYDYNIVHYSHQDHHISKETKMAQVDPSIITRIQQYYQCSSGKRSLIEFESNLCSSDCKCYEGQKGCTSDTTCQGDLKCQDNMCMRDEYFFIENMHAGKFLDLEGGACNDGVKLQLFEFTGSATQKFYYGKDGTIMSVACNKALTLDPSNLESEDEGTPVEKTCSNGVSVVLATHSGKYDQRIFVRKEYGVIQSEECDLVFDNSGGLSKNGNNIIMYKYHGGPNQEFVFHDHNMERPFYIQNTVTGKYITVKHGDCKNGNAIHQYEFIDDDSQKFYMGPNGSIVSILCEKALDIQKGSCDNGAKLILYEKHLGSNQRFEIRSDGSITNQMCKTAIDNKGGLHKNGNEIYLWEHNKRIGSRQGWRIHF